MTDSPTYAPYVICRTPNAMVSTADNLASEVLSHRTPETSTIDDAGVSEARATTRYRHLIASLTTDANRARARMESPSIRRGLRWANVAAGWHRTDGVLDG